MFGKLFRVAEITGNAMKPVQWKSINNLQSSDHAGDTDDVDVTRENPSFRPLVSFVIILSLIANSVIFSLVFEKGVPQQINKETMF